MPNVKNAFFPTSLAYNFIMDSSRKLILQIFTNWHPKFSIMASDSFCDAYFSLYRKLKMAFWPKRARIGETIGALLKIWNNLEFFPHNKVIIGSLSIHRYIVVWIIQLGDEL